MTCVTAKKMFSAHDMYLLVIAEVFFKILFWAGVGVFSVIAIVQIVILLRGDK